MVESERRSLYQRQIYRKWRPGDVYAPHDLSGAEQKKWKYGRRRPTEDAFDVLGINPLLEYKVKTGRTPRGHRVKSSVVADHNAELHHHVRVHDRDGPHQALA